MMSLTPQTVPLFHLHERRQKKRADQVIQNLVKKGWIARINMVDDPKGGTSTAVQWTELGRKRLQALYDLYDELGYSSGYIGGTFECLFDIMRMYVRMP